MVLDKLLGKDKKANLAVSNSLFLSIAGFDASGDCNEN